MPITTLFFDLDDTLIVEKSASMEALELTARHSKRIGADARRLMHNTQHLIEIDWTKGPFNEYCQRIGISGFECMWGGFDEEIPSFSRLATWANQFRIDVFTKALEEQNIQSPMAGRELSEVFVRSRTRRARLFPSTRHVIEKLSESYTLGLLTNGDPYFQRKKLDGAGIGVWFREVLVSGDLGFGKPDAKIFEHLCGRLNTTADSVIMIGNSLEHDILGAKNAGMRSIWLQLPGIAKSTSVEPDHVIHDLSEIPELLEKHYRSRKSHF